MRYTVVFMLLAGCNAGKITLTDAAPDTDLPDIHADTDPPNDSDPGDADTDSAVDPGDTDVPNDHTPAWDDDGDCYCEIGPCTGSLTPSCSNLVGGDCDDGRADVFPGAVEVCNGLDDNCASGIDETGTVGGSTFFADNDGDGFGAAGLGIAACAAPPRTVANADDCYDSNADAHPGATDWYTMDRGDGSFDYNCDGNAAQQYPYSYQCHYNCAPWLIEGWTGQVPACGDLGDRATGCQWSGLFSPTMPGCAPTANGASLQGCR